jgi:plastocyanin
MRGRVLAVPVVLLLMVGLALPVLAVLAPGGTFVDDDGSVHEGYIEAVAAAGITKGCNAAGDRFCPDEPVTRGQMAAFLNRAKGLAATSEDFFSDDDGTLFEGDINKLAAAGIAKGCDPPANTAFCPDDPVTRGQMAAFLVRTFGYSAGAGSDRFSDDDGSVFEADIEKLAEARVTLGCNPPTNDRYCPDNLVTRAEMATFLGRALNLTPILPPTTTTTVGGSSSTSDGGTTTTTEDGTTTSSSSTSSSTTTSSSSTTSTTNAGSTMDVTVGGASNTYQPDSIDIVSGDSVRFTNAGGNHNVVWVDGAPGSGSPSTSAWVHTRTFGSAGAFTFYCSVHGSPASGMRGTVTVS